MSPRRLGSYSLGLAAGGSVWIAGAWALWPSKLPDDLRGPELDPESLFTSAQLHDAERFELFLRWSSILSEVVVLVVLALYAWRGARLARESAAGRIGTGMLLGMLGLGILWFTQVPFGLADLWWERRHGLVDIGYVDWFLGYWLGLAGEFGFICLALLIVMLFAGALRDRWWIAGAPAFVALYAVFAWSSPYLIPDLRPLRDPELRAAAQRFAREQGIEPIPVSVEDVGWFTSAPNAEATGTGNSRRIILWSTFLDGRFDENEIEVVLAHELGHQSRDHILKSIGWYALFAVPGTFLIALATGRRGSLREPRAVPLALFVFTALTFAGPPVFGYISRRMETEADWIALETTKDPQAARALFKHFTTVALSDPSPPGWLALLGDTHPSTIERIELVEAWRARRAGAHP
jgi:Zn-dependent protease with chaperone function